MGQGRNHNSSCCQAPNTREARSKEPSAPPPVHISWGQSQVPAEGGQVGKLRQVAVTARSRVNASGVQRQGGGWEVSSADPGCWRGCRCGEALGAYCTPGQKSLLRFFLLLPQCLASHWTLGKQGRQTQTPTSRKPRAGGKASGESGVCLAAEWASSPPVTGTQAGSNAAPPSPGF